MAEEIRGANVVIPWCMVSTTLLNGIMGFAMLIVVLFVAVDIETVLQSPTGQLGFPFTNPDLLRRHRLSIWGLRHELHYHYHGYCRCNRILGNLIAHRLGFWPGPRPPVLADYE